MTQIRHLWFWFRGLSGKDQMTIVLELIGISVVTAYTTIAWFQSCQTGTANDLLRQQLVGTQAAIVTLSLMFRDNGELMANLVNEGRVTATDAHVRIDATKNTWPDDRPVGAPVVREYDVPPIAGQGGDQKTWTMPWHPHQLTDKQEWPKGWPGPETFSFSAKWSYKNGFGDKITGASCWKWVPNFTITTKRQSSGGGGLVDCRDFDAGIRETQEAEKHAEEERGGAPRPAP